MSTMMTVESLEASSERENWLGAVLFADGLFRTGVGF